MAKTKKKRKNRNYRLEEKDTRPEILELTKKYYTPSPMQRPMIHLNSSDRLFNAAKRLMRKYPGLTEYGLNELSCNLNEIYNKILTEHGLRNSNIGLRNMDTLDMAEMSDDEMDKLMKEKVWPHINELPPDQQIYYLIPCFRKGVIISDNNNRENAIWAIEYDVKNVDIEKRSMHVIMQSYHGDKTCNSPLTASYSGEYEITLEPIEPERMADANTPAEHWSNIYDAHIYTINGLTSADFNELLKPEQLCWNNLCYDIWREISINEMRKFEKEANARSDQHIAMATNFMTSVIIANYFIATHKAKQAEPVIDSIDSEQESTANSKTGNANKSRDSVTTGRVIYHIGKMRTVSRTKPRRVTKTNIRTYRVAEWSRRGHMRRLKSGKLVYIEPSVCHRKKERLGDQTLPFKSPPKTIKIHNQEQQE